MIQRIKQSTVCLVVVLLMVCFTGCEQLNRENNREPESAPQGFTVTSTVYGEVDFNWTAVAGATEYEIFHSTVENPSTATSLVSTDLTNHVANLTPNEIYSFWITAKNGTASSSYSTRESVDVANSLPAPTGLSVTSGSYGEVSLTWNVVRFATSYEIFYSVDADSSNAQRFSSDLPNFNASLTPDTLYYFWITAKNDTATSDSSSVMNITTVNTLSVPTNLSATSNTYGEVSLTWAMVKKATSYEVFYSKDSDSSVAASLGSTNLTNFTATLTPSERYYFWVEAKIDALTSGFSSGASVIIESTLPDLVAPTGLIATSSTYGEVSLTWNAVIGATEYEVFHSTNDTPSNATSVTTTNLNNFNMELTPNVIYYFWVRAKNTTAVSSYSPMASVPVKNTLSAPTGLSVTSDSYGEVSLTWDVVKKATSYDVFYSENPDYSTASIFSTNLTNFDVGLTPDVLFYFWIKAKTDTATSDFSSMESITTEKTLSAPTNFSATSNTYGKVSLTWNIVKMATEYQVFYSENSDSSSAKSLDTTELLKIEVELAAGKKYYFWVKAKVDMVTSDYSSGVSVTINNTLPAKFTPTNLEATSGSYGKVSLTWNVVSDATGYEVFYSTEDSSDNTRSLGSATLSTLTANLTAGETYYFWVKAKNSTATSDYSNMASVTIENTVPVPTDFLAISSSYGKVLLKWNTVDVATGYEVFYSTEDNSNNTSSLKSTTLTTLTADFTAGEKYYFWVKSNVDAASSEYSSVASVTIENTVPIPINFSATSVIYGKVLLKWDAVTVATGYEVFYSTENNSGNTSRLGSTTLPTFTADFTPGTTYYFWVKAKIDALESDYSSMMSVTVENTPAPTNFLATSTNYGEVSFAWDAVEGATVYEIFYATDSNFSTVASLISTRETSIAVDLTPSERYWFKVNAKKPPVTGAFSTVVSVTIKNTLSAPTGFSAIYYPSGQVSLTWNVVSKATSYEVFYSTGSDSSKVTSLGSTTLTTAIKNLAPSVEYYFWIQAKNATVESNLSSMIVASRKNYEIGDTGPGGGLVFYINGTTVYECSDNLGTADWYVAKQMGTDFRGGGYENWHLPTKDELNYIYLNLAKTSVIKDSGWFWSSFDNDGSDGAWQQHFDAGNGHYVSKTVSNNVRVVRNFSSPTF